MANLKEVRGRISSVKTTQQITKAMKLVAASKLKRAQDRITMMRPYSNKLFEMLGNLLHSIEGGELGSDLSTVRPIQKVLLVVVTSDKGLCGAYNSGLIKKSVAHIRKNYANGEEVTILTIGKKGNDYYKKLDYTLISDHVNTLQGLNFEGVSPIAEMLADRFSDETYDRVDVIYSKFKSAGTQILTAEQFLPIGKLEDADAAPSNINADYIFQPNQEEILDTLIPKILKTQFYRYLLDSNASEHGARMVAMDSATENANELLNDLKLLYNKERQAAITGEILEIVSGAAALN